MMTGWRLTVAKDSVKHCDLEIPNHSDSATHWHCGLVTRRTKVKGNGRRCCSDSGWHSVRRWDWRWKRDSVTVMEREMPTRLPKAIDWHSGKRWVKLRNWGTGWPMDSGTAIHSHWDSSTR